MDFNISKSNQGELIRNKSSIKETTTRVENQPSSLSPSPGNESFCFPQPSLRNVWSGNCRLCQRLGELTRPQRGLTPCPAAGRSEAGLPPAGGAWGWGEGATGNAGVSLEGSCLENAHRAFRESELGLPSRHKGICQEQGEHHPQMFACPSLSSAVLCHWKRSLTSFLGLLWSCCPAELLDKGLRHRAPRGGCFMETVTDSTWFSWTPKSLLMVTAATKLKDACSLEEKLW